MSLLTTRRRGGTAIGVYRLRDRREARRLSQTRIAHMCGVTQAAYRAWEVDGSTPNTLVAARLAEVLGITQAELNEDLARDQQDRQAEKRSNKGGECG